MENSPALAVKPLPKSDLVDSEEVIGEELFLYDEITETVQQLNSGAAIIWFLCDGERDVEGMTREIVATFGVPEQEALDQVQEAVAQFQELGLLEPGTVDPSP
jgi:hypothetical protein